MMKAFEDLFIVTNSLQSVYIIYNPNQEHRISLKKLAPNVRSDSHFLQLQQGGQT
jgi:hypothetical protein